MTDNPQSIYAEDKIRGDIGKTGGWKPGALGAIEANDKLGTDHITKLESRAEMENNLQVITEENKPACILFLDVDHFKNINDANGHQVGDVVLENLGLRFRRSISQTDHAGRWGGEEFVIVFDGLSDLNIAKERAEEIRVSIEKMPVSIGELKIPVTLSIGVAVRKLGEDYIDLVNRGDKAMYLAKDSGRNRVKTEQDLEKLYNV